MNQISPTSDFSVECFGTLELGIGFDSGRDLDSALRRRGCRISLWAGNILSSPKVILERKRRLVRLAAVSPAELDTVGRISIGQFYSRARKRGLQLCAPEIGPRLRLFFSEQPIGDGLTIAMEPIVASDGREYIFAVDCDRHGRWLSDAFGNKSFPIEDPGRRFVFEIH